MEEKWGKRCLYFKRSRHLCKTCKINIPRTLNVPETESDFPEKTSECKTHLCDFRMKFPSFIMLSDSKKKKKAQAPSIDIKHSEMLP